MSTNSQGEELTILYTMSCIPEANPVVILYRIISEVIRVQNDASLKTVYQFTD